jgi:hypothetical protein
MGLLDIFRMGKVIVGTVKAVRNQRNLGQELAALPMPGFVSECLANLNQSAGNWEGRARPPIDSAASIAKLKQLPDELAEFYSLCDGFEAVHGDFPACIYRIQDLQAGEDHTPSLSSLLLSYWKENGNDSEKPGLLSVLPPDNLTALATHSPDCYLHPSAVDVAVPLCPPQNGDFVVVLLADAGERLPRGTVLDVEGGSATRYASFKSWLGTRASLFGSLGSQSRAQDNA